MDAGVGTELTTTAGFDQSNNFKSLSLSLKGGGGFNIFCGSKDTYYCTEIEIPKEYGQILKNAGSSLVSLITSSGGLPLGPSLLNTTVNAVKTAYNNFQAVPVRITTSEIRGKGFELNLSLDLDAALGVGLGVSLGVNGKYYDELAFPQKVSDIYLNGNNYLLYTSNYSYSMEEDDFSNVMRDILSGALPLVKQSFNNILNTVTEIYIAGKQFLISSINSAGETLGEITGTIQQAGTWVVSTFSSFLPRVIQKSAFDKPQFKRMYYSTNIMHPLSNGSSRYTEVNSKLIVVSETMIVGFIPEGQSETVDSLASQFMVKMLIDENQLIENDFSSEDKDKIKIYYFDDLSQNWLLLGGNLSGDTVLVSTNKLGAFALGIEINNMEDDKRTPSLIDYGPKSGSILTVYPEVYAIVSEDKYGSGLDLANTFIIINGDSVDFSFDPVENKIYYQLSDDDDLNNKSVSVQIIWSDLAGNSTNVDFDFSLNVTDINKNELLPTEYVLYQNFPNPFNPETTIKFGIPEKANVEINIYDITGRYIKTVYSGELDASYFSVIWNGTNNFGHRVASGIYFYQLKTKAYNAVRKLIILK